MQDSQYKELVKRSKDGDVGAFNALFDMLVDRLWGYALSRTGSEEAAEDAVQETFIELWSALQRLSYEGDAPFLGYVYTILRRKVAWHHRDGARRATAPLPEQIEDESESEYVDHRYLAQLLETLSETYREVIQLRYWGALTFAEIGATLDMDENAAKVTHHRALKKLQELHAHHE